MCAFFTRSKTNVTMRTNNDVSLMECDRNLPTFHRNSLNFYKNRWHSILQTAAIIVNTVSHKPLISVRRQKRLHISLLYPLKLPTSLCPPSLNDTELRDCEGIVEIFQVMWWHSLKYMPYIAFNGKVFINPWIRRETLKKYEIYKLRYLVQVQGLTAEQSCLLRY
jgi:hypothetical protein